MQKGIEELFRVISEHSASVPIIVIGTKKDIFLNMKKGEAIGLRSMLEGDFSTLQSRIEDYAETALKQRQKAIEGKLLDIPGAKYNNVVYVSSGELARFVLLLNPRMSTDQQSQTTKPRSRN